MNKRHFALSVIAIFLAVSGAGAGGVQAAPFGPVLPLSPVSQQNAVRAAKNYLSTMPFSRNGLINQLTAIEGYSTEDATFAVDNITVDWDEQAAKAAKNYLSTMPFSRNGLVNQLTAIEGYTYAQAEYGVTAVGF